MQSALEIILKHESDFQGDLWSRFHLDLVAIATLFVQIRVSRNNLRLVAEAISVPT